LRILSEEEALAAQGPGRPQKYPWKEWLVDGRPFEIYHGEDYEVPTENMRVQVSKAAERMGGKVSTKRIHDPEGLRVTFRRNLTPNDFDFDDLPFVAADDQVGRALRGEALGP
jgi:hypothetical protein